MPHYMFRATYTQKGIEGTRDDGAASRIPAWRDTFASLGGKFETAYWTLGDEDIVIIGEFPDAVAAVAASVQGRLAGTGKVVTTALLTAEEFDSALNRDIDYKPLPE